MPKPGEVLVFGRLADMRKALAENPAILNAPGASDTKLKMAGGNAIIGGNPDYLIVYDQGSGLISGGTANCLTCKNMQSNLMCRSVIIKGDDSLAVAGDEGGAINEKTVRRSSTGGCFEHDWRHDLGETWEDTTFLEIINEVYGEGGRGPSRIVVWRRKTGSITPLEVGA